jgi:hypothetical protein
MAPPGQSVMEWLTKLNLARHAEHYATILDDLGYDDPADLINFNEERWLRGLPLPVRERRC